jgi:putative membrane protein
LTTATTAGYPSFRENRFLQRLCILFVAVLLLAAYHPDAVFDFFLENGSVLVFLVIMTLTYRQLPLSDLSYLLIFIFLCIHEWGAHYKYSDVPLGEWMKPWLHTQRNHYDRVAHFSFGLLAVYSMLEMFVRKARVSGRWQYYLPVGFVLALSAIYEMLEAFMANILTPERGEEFVGMQGDMWDSQKDMFDAGVGAVAGVVLIYLIRKRRARRVPTPAQAGPPGN